jgi:hypothetical protein
MIIAPKIAVYHINLERGSRQEALRSATGASTVDVMHLMATDLDFCRLSDT